MSFQIENIVNAYKTLAKIPVIVRGKLNNSRNRITSKWSVRNIDKGKNTQYLYNYTLDNNLKVIAESEFGHDVSNELLSAVSPNETYKAVIREDKDGKEIKKQFLEVWQANQLSHSIELTALDLHGDVYADSEFGVLNWSKDESAIVYVAEKKLKKYESYIKRKSVENSSVSNEDGKKIEKGEEHLFRQDWGEQLVGKKLSVIVVCQVKTESFTVLNGLPDSWCPGQVRFTNDGRGVVGVAWETEPRRLGLIFCTNRPGYVFHLTLDGQLSKWSAEGKAVRSPRITATGDIVWLQRPVGGPHHGCHEMVIRNTENKVTSIVDIVKTEKLIENASKFYGIYSQALPENCFSVDGKRVVFSTPQETEVKSYVVDIDGGRMIDISVKDYVGSTTVLDVKEDVVLAVFSNMITPPQLYVAHLPPSGEELDIQWIRVSRPTEVPQTVGSSSVDYMHLTREEGKFNALCFVPQVSGDKKVPLIVWPHGGPHSNFVNSYSLEAALFNMLGFGILQVNYRGSTGVGQASVDFLLKRVGDSDVQDCKQATDNMLNKYSFLDKGNVCLMGGSHGGFLVTHLSGQHPDVYHVVVTRNPVTDVATMFNSTDIPDWCAVEAGFEFTEHGPMSEDELLAMRRCSPLVHAHKVKAPTALMLGSGDKRVPYYQGLEYSRRLKANGVPTKVYLYDDNHSLSSLAAEMDNLINTAIWFLQHLKE